MTIDHDSRVRTHLANERTFLAWFRTGITLVALGLAGAQFLEVKGEEGAALVRGLCTVVIGTGASVVVVGMYRYRAGRRHIDAEDFRPAWLSITVAAVAALLTAALGIAFVWLLPRG